MDACGVDIGVVALGLSPAPETEDMLSEVAALSWTGSAPC